MKLGLDLIDWRFKFLLQFWLFEQLICERKRGISQKSLYIYADLLRKNKVYT